MGFFVFYTFGIVIVILLKIKKHLESQVFIKSLTNEK